MWHNLKDEGGEGGGGRKFVKLTRLYVIEFNADSGEGRRRRRDALIRGAAAVSGDISDGTANGQSVRTAGDRLTHVRRRYRSMGTQETRRCMQRRAARGRRVRMGRVSVASRARWSTRVMSRAAND